MGCETLWERAEGRRCTQVTVEGCGPRARGGKNMRNKHVSKGKNSCCGSEQC